MKKTHKLILIMLLILVSFFSFKCCSAVTTNEVKTFLLGFGLLAPIVYILLFTFVPLTLFPDAILAVSAGLVFGTAFGIVYTVIGAICGGTLAFFISRKLSMATFADKLNKHKKMHSLIENRGFIIILCLRLIPLIPFDVISYASGATNVKYRDYILATFLGILPGVTILVSIGDAVSSAEQSRLYMSLAALVLLFAFAPKGKKYIFGLDTKEELLELED